MIRQGPLLERLYGDSKFALPPSLPVSDVFDSCATHVALSHSLGRVFVVLFQPEALRPYQAALERSPRAPQWSRTTESVEDAILTSSLVWEVPHQIVSARVSADFFAKEFRLHALLTTQRQAIQISLWYECSKNRSPTLRSETLSLRDEPQRMPSSVCSVLMHTQDFLLLLCTCNTVLLLGVRRDADRVMPGGLSLLLLGKALLQCTGSLSSVSDTLYDASGGGMQYFALAPSFRPGMPSAPAPYTVIELAIDLSTAGARDRLPRASQCRAVDSIAVRYLSLNPCLEQIQSRQLAYSMQRCDGAQRLLVHTLATVPAHPGRSIALAVSSSALLPFPLPSSLHGVPFINHQCSVRSMVLCDTHPDILSLRCSCQHITRIVSLPEPSSECIVEVFDLASGALLYVTNYDQRDNTSRCTVLRDGSVCALLYGAGHSEVLLYGMQTPSYEEFIADRESIAFSRLGIHRALARLLPSHEPEITMSDGRLVTNSSNEPFQHSSVSPSPAGSLPDTASGYNVTDEHADELSLLSGYDVRCATARLLAPLVAMVSQRAFAGATGHLLRMLSAIDAQVFCEAVSCAACSAYKMQGDAGTMYCMLVAAASFPICSDSVLRAGSFLNERLFYDTLRSMLAVQCLAQRLRALVAAAEESDPRMRMFADVLYTALTQLYLQFLRDGYATLLATQRNLDHRCRVVSSVKSAIGYMLSEPSAPSLDVILTPYKVLLHEKEDCETTAVLARAVLSMIDGGTPPSSAVAEPCSRTRDELLTAAHLLSAERDSVVQAFLEKAVTKYVERFVSGIRGSLSHAADVFLAFQGYGYSAVLQHIIGDGVYEDLLGSCPELLKVSAATYKPCLFLDLDYLPRVLSCARFQDALAPVHGNMLQCVLAFVQRCGGIEAPFVPSQPGVAQLLPLSSPDFHMNIRVSALSKDAVQKSACEPRSCAFAGLCQVVLSELAIIHAEFVDGFCVRRSRKLDDIIERVLKRLFVLGADSRPFLDFEGYLASLSGSAAVPSGEPNHFGPLVSGISATDWVSFDQYLSVRILSTGVRADTGAGTHSDAGPSAETPGKDPRPATSFVLLLLSAIQYRGCNNPGVLRGLAEALARVPQFSQENHGSSPESVLGVFLRTLRYAWALTSDIFLLLLRHYSTIRSHITASQLYAQHADDIASGSLDCLSIIVSVLITLVAHQPMGFDVLREFLQRFCEEHDGLPLSDAAMQLNTTIPSLVCFLLSTFLCQPRTYGPASLQDGSSASQAAFHMLRFDTLLQFLQTDM